MAFSFGPYLSRIESAFRAGDATEHTHRGALVEMLDAFAADLGLALRATNEPKQAAYGAPDVVVKRGELAVAHLEAKDVGKPLDREQTSEQMKRYRKALPNLVLTDYLEFRLYVDGEAASQKRGRLAVPDASGKLTADAAGQEAVRALLTDWLSRAPEPIATPERLAVAMARRTDMIRDVVEGAFRAGGASATLKDLRTAFAQTLVPDLADDDRLDDFVDMYAQTLAYGLFAARVHHAGAAETFTRQAAAQAIPRTNPLLRKLFGTLTGLDLDDEPHAGLVGDLVAVLAHTDMAAVLRDFGKRTRRDDPVVHFYETFLAAYAPEVRQLRGVYYTPAPVVSFLVRSVDQILRRDFGVERGLADDSTVAFKTPQGTPEERPRVLILDPACGTGTFLYHVVDHVRQTFIAREDESWSAYVGQKLLPRLFGFELLMAPYAVAHLKLGLELAGADLPEDEQAAYRYAFDADERLQVYLTNTLEEADREIADLFGPFRAISDEAKAAARVKEDRPIMVILGNPPYSGHSANDGGWIRGLVEDYKRGFPDLYRPGQAKWLHDDYVKFIRWAEWRLSRTGYGIVSFITNNGYLDNPTFKGMRKHLRESFDALYLLNLHGSTKKKETAPNGSADVNVFDIQQGVTLGIFVKRPGVSEAPGRVFYADLYGGREAKYDALEGSDVTSTAWEEIEPNAPFHLFIPQDDRLRPEYERGMSVADIFDQNGPPAMGMVTMQDGFAISFTREEVDAKVGQFLKTKDEAEAREVFRLCNPGQWSYDRARGYLSDDGWREDLIPLLARPFDERWTVYDRNVAVHRRERVSKHFVGRDNLGLIVTKKLDVAGEWEHVWMTDKTIHHHAASMKEGNYVFPLYLYPDESTAATDLFSNASGGVGEATDPAQVRRPNLSPPFVAALEAATGWAFVPEGAGTLAEDGGTVGSEAVLAYAYAVFHSPAFRARYAAFLRIDFPRLPLTTDRALFRALVGHGQALVDLHLLRRVPEAGRPVFKLGGQQTTAVGASPYPRYVAPEASESGRGRVYVNETQYAEGVPPEAWAFTVGGYQPAQKWLKDRRGRALTHDEMEHYAKTVAALDETGKAMAAVDAEVEAAGGFPFT